MTPSLKPLTVEHDVIFHPSGDLILPVLLDPAVAAQVRVIADRWGNERLSDTVSDLVLVGLMSVNSTARLS